MAIFLLSTLVQAYTPYDKAQILLEIDASAYTLQSRSALLLETEDNGGVVANSTNITQACSSVHVFHNQNLSCQFNATSTENFLSWSVNDSRVTIVGNNFTAYVVDNPSLSDYNMPNGWTIVVTANGSSSSGTANMQYYINDTAPTFNETISNFTFYNTLNFTFNGNFSDVEADNASAFVNCTLLNITVNNATHNYSLNHTADSGASKFQLCNVTLSDTVLFRSQFFYVNITIDPGTVASYNITYGANMSALYPKLYPQQFNVTPNRRNLTTMQLWYYNASQQNQSVNNPMFRFNNTDNQALNIRCNISIIVPKITVKLSLFSNGSNASNITGNNSLIAASRAANTSTATYAFFDYNAYNYTAQVNDSTAIVCEMKVS